MIWIFWSLAVAVVMVTVPAVMAMSGEYPFDDTVLPLTVMLAPASNEVGLMRTVV